MNLEMMIKNRRWKKEYYHVQWGMRGILILWIITISILTVGFSWIAYVTAGQQSSREKESIYTAQAAYLCRQIDETSENLYRTAHKIAAMSDWKIKDMVDNSDAVDGAAVCENGEIKSYFNQKEEFLAFYSKHEKQLLETRKKQAFLAGTYSDSRYHTGKIQLGWLLAASNRNVLVFRTIDTQIDGYSGMYLYDTEAKILYPQGYLRPDFTSLKEKLNQGANNLSLKIPSYVTFSCKSEKYGFYVVLCVAQERLGTDTSSYLRMLAAEVLLLVLLLGITFWVFHKKVYRPIISVENAVNGILNGKKGLSLDIDSASELSSTGRAINSMISHVEELTSREYQSELLKRQAELNALQNQINPHFLYNTLESIRGLALQEGSRNAANMAKALANLFRYNIDNRNLTVTLKEEMSNINNYFTIQKYRFSNKIRLVTYIDDQTMDLWSCHVPHMILQPIIENAVCHGLELKRGGGTVILMAMATENRILISVNDDGVGMDEKTLDQIEERLQGRSLEAAAGEKTGIALFNVNERIRILYGSDYGIHVHSTRGIGTEVEIVLPLIP